MDPLYVTQTPLSDNATLTEDKNYINIQQFRVISTPNELHKLFHRCSSFVNTLILRKNVEKIERKIVTYVSHFFKGPDNFPFLLTSYEINCPIPLVLDRFFHIFQLTDHPLSPIIKCLFRPLGSILLAHRAQTT